MKKRTVWSVILILFLFACPLLAQEEEHDVVEINVFSGIGIPLGDLTDWKTTTTVGDELRAAKTGWDLGVDAGFFLSSSVIVGVNFIYNQFSLDAELAQSNHHHRLYNPNLYLKYLWEGESNWVPYMKIHAGVENPKFSTYVIDEVVGQKYRELSYGPSPSVGAAAGLFYYTADYSGLFLEVDYRHAFSSGSTATYRDREYELGANVDALNIHAGIRILIGSGE
jgi:hypothetical protein